MAQGFLEDPREGTKLVDADPAKVFLQYKNTVACFDFTCGECGAHAHFDGDFAYIVRCECGATYEMPPLLYPRRVEVTTGGPVAALKAGESLPASQSHAEDTSLPAGCLSTCDWRGGPIHAPGCPNG